MDYVDSNKYTAQIIGTNSRSYQRKFNGGKFCWTGSASNWQTLSSIDANIIDRVAASPQLYWRRKDGSAARLSGSSLVSINQPCTPGSRRIAVTDDRTLWDRLANGYLVRST